MFKTVLLAAAALTVAGSAAAQNAPPMDMSWAIQSRHLDEPAPELVNRESQARWQASFCRQWVRIHAQHVRDYPWAAPEATPAICAGQAPATIQSRRSDAAQCHSVAIPGDGDLKRWYYC
jgi:hypothetical protein